MRFEFEFVGRSQLFGGSVSFIQIFCHMVRSHGTWVDQVTENLNKTETAYIKLTWPTIRPCQFYVGLVSFITVFCKVAFHKFLYFFGQK